MKPRALTSPRWPRSFAPGAHATRLAAVCFALPASAFIHPKELSPLAPPTPTGASRRETAS